MPLATLAANLYPAGTQPGSPIKVVDTHTTNGGTEFTASIPIPVAALPGDVVWAFFGFATSGTTSIGAITSSPSGFFASAPANFGFSGGGGMAELAALYRVVQQGDAGRQVGVAWPATLNQLGWGVVVYTLRYVDSVVLFDTSLTSGVTSGTGASLNTSTGTIATVRPGTLVAGAIAAEGGTVGVGLGAGPLPGWRQTTTAVGAGQPNTALVSGLMDMPIAGTYLGAGCQFNASGTPVNTNWAGNLIAFRAMPAPGAPSVTLAPSGSSIDAAGASGTPLSVSWVYTPASGQGSQEAWLIARQPNGGGTLQFYNADSNQWVTAEYWNLGPQTSFQFPTSAWANDGTNWDLSVAVRESSLHLKSAVAGPFTFTADAPPSLSSVSITNPNTATPTVSWVETLTMAPQVGYRVRVFSSDQIALSGFNPANILVGDDSDFELTAGTWTSLNSTASLGATTNYTGGGDLKIQANTTGGVSALSGSYPVTAGVRYYATGFVWADTTPRAMHLGFSWQDVNGNQISTTSGSAVTDSTSAWTQLAVNGTAPTGAVTARLTVASTVSAVNEVHRLDQAHWAATPVPRWTSGMVLSTATSTATGTLVAGGSYTAYVQVLQTNDQLTPTLPVTGTGYVNSPTATWHNGAAAAPAQPTIAVVAQNDPTTGAPTNLVTVTGHDTGGFAGTGTALVEFSDDQVTWKTLRNGGAVVLPVGTGQVGTVTDFEVFQNTVRYYRATVSNTDLSTLTSVTSATGVVASATATSSPASVWIVPPLNPGASFAAPVEDIEQVQTEQLATHMALGRTDPIVIFDVVNGKDATLTFFTISAAEDAAIDTVIAQQAVLWISTPMGEGYYIRLGPSPGGATSSGGATVKSTKIDNSPLATPVRETKLTYVVVKRP